jgi:hypothetical protein
MSEESRFQHCYIQLSSGARRRLRSKATDAIQKRIQTMNQRYNQNEISIDEFLDGLSLLIAQKR